MRGLYKAFLNRNQSVVEINEKDDSTYNPFVGLRDNIRDRSNRRKG